MNFLQSLAVCEAETEYLEFMVKNLKDYSKLFDFQLPVSKSNFDIRALVRDLERKFKLLVKFKDVEFCSYIDRTLPVSLYHDRRLVLQALQILILNSLKYTNTG